METVGEIVALLRAERRWTQGQLAEKIGFSRGYVGHVEYTGMGTVPFLTACERAFELEPGSLVKWPIYSTVKKLCRRYKISISDFRRFLEAADNSFRPLPAGGPTPQDFGELRNQTISRPGIQAEPTNQERHFYRLTRRIMSTIEDTISEWFQGLMAAQTFLAFEQASNLA